MGEGGCSGQVKLDNVGWRGPFDNAVLGRGVGSKGNPVPSKAEALQKQILEAEETESRETSGMDLPVAVGIFCCV